jgi:hypothetical protein
MSGVGKLEQFSFHFFTAVCEIEIDSDDRFPGGDVNETAR